MHRDDKVLDAQILKVTRVFNDVIHTECLMSYDEKTDKMDWKDECSWMPISLIAGMLLSFIFFDFEKFSKNSSVVVLSVCCIGFYILSILLRIQNYRGKVLTGKKAREEGRFIS